MATKTCMQRNPMTGRKVRRKHAIEAGDDGYGACTHCGVTVYVGFAGTGSINDPQWQAADADFVRRNS